MSTIDRSMANRPPPLRRAPIIAALDVGTSKVVCLIATGDERGGDCGFWDRPSAQRGASRPAW